MTRKETAKVVAVVCANYATSFRNMPKGELESMITAWSMTLGEYEYEKVNIGLMWFMKTDKSGFPPAPGQIIAKMPSRSEEMLNEKLALDMHNIARLSG